MAEFSKTEKRILITNDKHFADSAEFSKENIFSVVLLRIPQEKPELLLSAFSKLLKEIKQENFEGNLVTLYENTYEIESLFSSYSYN